MLVQSQPTHGGITNSNLEKWYLDKHIPEVLNAGGVRGVLFCQLNHESSKNDFGESQPKLYLAVYLLPDLDWLHEEGCGLWRLALVLGSDDEGLEIKHRGRSVFEVAEFVTHFWEVADSPEGMLPPKFMATAFDGDKTVKGAFHAYCRGIGRLGTYLRTTLTRSPEPTKHLVLSYFESLPYDHSSSETRPNLADSDWMTAPTLMQKPAAVISTLFKVDETCPGPPSAKGEEGGVPTVLPETRYLHCVSEVPRLISGVDLVSHTAVLRSLSFAAIV